MNNKLPTWLMALVIALWAGLVAYAWSPRNYWPDADGYLLHVAEGRWVAHPPGYALFVMIGRLFYVVGFTPYLSVQLASLSLTVAGLLVLYRLMRELLEPARAFALAGAAAFSWLTLLNVQTGTSHASDLFTVSLLLLTAIRLRGARKETSWGRDLLFALSLLVCAAFRLTTLLMLTPLCLLVAWRNCRRPSFWISCVCGAIAIVGWQMWVIAQSGGYEAYSASAAAMNADNTPSSLVLSGFTQTTALNVFRALLWVGLGTSSLLVVIITGLGRQPPGTARIPLIYGTAAALGPLAAVALYLCTHPGYVVSVIPGAALAAAALVSNSSVRFPWRPFLAANTAVVALFLFAKPIISQGIKWHAVANGVLLQYSANCSRQAVFNTTARWLRLGGLEGEIPPHRVIDLGVEDEWRRKFETIDPSHKR